MKKRKKNIDRPKIGHRPRKWTDLDLFQQRIDQFFSECDAGKRPPSVTGLAMSLSISREQLLRYEDERPGYSEAVKKARERIQRGIEEAIIEGGKAGKNVVGLIFWLKNNANWRDVMGLEHTGADGAPLEMSSLEVAARISTILEIARTKREQDAQAAQKVLPEKIPD